MVELAIYDEPVLSFRNLIATYSNAYILSCSKGAWPILYSGYVGGCTSSPSAYLEAAMLPHDLHRRFSSSAPNSSTTAFTCVPRSVHTKCFSQTTSLQLRQYHRIMSTASLARGCSITTPTVSLNLTGQCGVLAGSKKMEPSWIGMSWNVGGVVDVSTVLRSIEPRY